MKRVKLTEQQLEDLSKKESIVVEDGVFSNHINKMRHDTSDFKQGELKQLCHRFIDRAFWLGNKYAKMKLDIEGRTKIMKKLDKMNMRIDKIPM